MNRKGYLLALDELRVRAWEQRDLLIKIARNESWNVIHHAPVDDVRAAVTLARETCDNLCQDLTTAEERECSEGLTSDFQASLWAFEYRLQTECLRYLDMLNKISNNETKLTHRARFRKSYIRS